MAVDQDEDLELSRSDLSPDYVRRRVESWVRKIDDLYAEIRKSAAAKLITVEDGAPTTMDEELMRRYGIPSRQLPTLLIKKADGIIKVIPKGLWVIGANGRIDLFTSRGLFMLVDFAAEPFDRPHWKIYGPDRRAGVDFTPDELFDLV
jgi:hypothetical protein